MQVRWNNADRAGVAADLNDVEQWYEAAGYVRSDLVDGWLTV